VATPIVLTRLDPRYPSRLSGFAGAPASMSWQGGSLEADRVVAIVGARCARDDSLSFTTEIAGALARTGAVVVSGGATGIDSAAHAGALHCGGRTWAVAGTGPDHCYPPCNAGLFEAIARGPGAMLWPFDGGGRRGAFLARNHVLVALADAVVVVQAGLKSGALHAASCARRLSKPLWVVPASPWMAEFAGSLQLLETGARALTSLELLLRSLGGPPDASVSPRTSALITIDLSPCEISVLEAVSEGPLHVDAIVARAKQSAQAVNAALLTLALENVVVEGPPGLFRRRAPLSR
jgi:DNA processing protein